MKLSVQKRACEGKKEAKRLRREGQIPGVIYGKEGKSIPVTFQEAEFSAALRSLKKGCLSTTLFSLKGDGLEGEGVVKDIQYHPTSYKVLHLDFEQIEKDRPIAVSIPMHCVGMADCPGIKTSGGVLRQVIRMLPVRGLPHKIPNEVIVDVSSLEMKQTKRLLDITLPEGVTPRAKLEEVVVVIAKR